jgi:hypothetical protein
MSHMTRLLVLIVVVTSSVVVPKALSGSAHGQPGCAAATLSGPYGIQGSGGNVGVAIAFVGVLLFDGQGKVTTASPVIANVGGTIDPIDVSGTYKTNADCTAKAFIQTAHRNPPRTTFHDIDMVIVNDGAEALFMIGGVKNSESEEPRPGEVLSGVLKRV